MQDLPTYNGQLFVIAAASGTGKTSLIKALLDSDPHLTLAISHSTRPIRTDEKEGINYHFVSANDFKSMQKDKAFVEWAEVFGHFYGTSFLALQLCLKTGKDVILEIDWQGALQIQEKIANTIGIFLLPPTMEQLAQRLKDRRRDTPETIERRLAAAHLDIDHYRDFDYLVVNQDFEKAQADLAGIIKTERLRTHRQQGHLADLLQAILPDSKTV